MRSVGQAGELQVRSPDLARQGRALLQVPIRFLELKGPHLGNTKADQRRSAQILAQPELRGVGRLCEGEQPLRLLGHHREVDEPPGQEEPQHRQHDLHASAAVRRYRR